MDLVWSEFNYYVWYNWYFLFVVINFNCRGLCVNLCEFYFWFLNFEIVGELYCILDFKFEFYICWIFVDIGWFVVLVLKVEIGIF